MANGLALVGLLGLFLRKHPSRVVFAAALFGPTLIYRLIQVIARYGYPARPIALLMAMDLGLGVLAWARARAVAPGGESPA